MLLRTKKWGGFVDLRATPRATASWAGIGFDRNCPYLYHSGTLVDPTYAYRYRTGMGAVPNEIAL